MATALVAGACDGEGTAETTFAATTTTTLAPTTTATSSPTTSSTTSTTTTSTTTTSTLTLTTTTTTTAVPLSPLAWSRVPHDETVMGGPNNQEMLSVTAAGPDLVAVGWAVSGGDLDAAVWTSVDGVTWSRVPHGEAVLGGAGNQAIGTVTAGGPGLVAVGSDTSGGDFDAAVWTSPDGIAWSRVPHDEAALGGQGNQVMNGVTVGGPGLVVVGMDGSGGDEDAAVWTSPDGVTWSRVRDEAALAETGDQRMQSVTAGGPGLVAVGWDGSLREKDAAVWASPDGVTWSRVPHDEAVFGGEDRQEMRGVTAGGPGLVAVGWDGPGGDFDAAVWTSVDGIAWSRVPHDEAALGGERDQSMRGVTAGGPGLVAFGSDFSGGDQDAAVWTSLDGVTWSRVLHDEAVFGGAGFQSIGGVTVGGPGLVAVGRAGPGDDVDAAVWAAAREGATTTQQEEACSATGLAVDTTGGEGLPQAVADVRLAIIEAALACDYDRLAELARAGRPTFTYSFGDTSDTSAQTPPVVWDAAAYWLEAEAFGEPVLATLVQVLGLSYAQIETQFDSGVFTPVYEWPADANLGDRVGITDDGDWVYLVGGD